MQASTDSNIVEICKDKSLACEGHFMSNGQGIYVLSEFPVSTCLTISGLTACISGLR
jgi:hypothetical protein